MSSPNPANVTTINNSSSDGVVLFESTLILVILAILIFIGIVVGLLFFLKKRWIIVAKIGWPAIVIGIGVVIATLIIYAVCRWRAGRAKNCASFYDSDEAPKPLGPSQIPVDEYIITSDFTEGCNFDVSPIYANDPMSFTIVFKDTTQKILETPTVLTMQKYYGKTIIIYKRLDTTNWVSTVDKILANFQHGSTIYQARADLIAASSNNSIIVRIPVFGYIAI